MKLSYNVTGAERKTLVGAISQELNAPTKYLGMPTAAYEVGEYTIDKTGTVTGPDNLDLEDALHQKGFDATEREYDEPDTYESGLGGMGAVDDPADFLRDIDQHSPGQYADPNVPVTEEMMRQADAWMEGQPEYGDLHMTEHEELGLGRERRDPAGEDGMQASDVPEPDEIYPASGEDDSFTIEMPRAGFTETAIANLEKLVESKAALIKKALDTDDLTIEQTEDTLRFPWFRFGLQPEEANAYARFVSALCAMAKEQKRVTATAKDVDNEKYAFRCFLLRLGFIGDDCKAERKILLSKLSGNGSFKNGERRQPVDEPVQEAAVPTAPDSLAEALADAELIHQVNASFDTEGGDGQ
jgi:hypothetical protein